MMRKIIWLSLISLAIFIMATFALVYVSGPNGSAYAQDTRKSPTYVEVALPLRHNITQRSKIPAEVSPLYAAQIYARVSGYVGEVKVDIGQQVKKGEVLLIVAVPELEKEHAQTLAQVRRYQAEILRYQAEIKRLEAEHRQLEMQITRAEAEIERVKTTLANAETLAEISGRIYQRLASAIVQTPNLVSQDQADEALARQEMAKGQVKQEKAGLKIAEADLAIAGQALKTAEVERESLQATIDALTAQKEAAQATADVIKTRLDFAVVSAPFAGYVTRRAIDPGDLVNETSAPLLEIMDIGRVRVHVHVPEKDIPHIKTGEGANTVSIATPILLRPLAASVTRISRAVDPATRTMLVEMEVPNPDGNLRPGMYVYTEITLVENDNALVIPARSLVVEGKNLYVYVVEKNQVYKRAVKTGYDDGKIVEVVNGINSQDRVVIAGKNMIFEGEEVVATEKIWNVE